MLRVFIELQLNKPINKTKNINWIPLPSKTKPAVKAKKVCSIAGWGKQSDTGAGSSHLREVDVTVIDTKNCEEIWGKPFSVSGLICTRGHGAFCQVKRHVPYTIKRNYYIFQKYEM